MHARWKSILVSVSEGVFTSVAIEIVLCVGFLAGAVQLGRSDDTASASARRAQG